MLLPYFIGVATTARTRARGAVPNENTEKYYPMNFMIAMRIQPARLLLLLLVSTRRTMKTTTTTTLTTTTTPR